MIKKTLMEKIYLEVAERVKELGFTKRFKKGNQCKKIFPWGYQALQLCYITHATDFDVTVELGIKFTAMAEIGGTGNKLGGGFGVNLGNWMGIGQHRWRIEKEADITPAADNIVMIFKEHGLAYLDKYSSMEEVWLTITGQKNQDEAESVMSEKLIRSKGIIRLAILLNKPNLDKIIADTRAYMAGFNDDWYNNKLEEFINSLDVEAIKNNIKPSQLSLVAPSKLQ